MTRARIGWKQPQRSPNLLWLSLGPSTKLYSGWGPRLAGPAFLAISSPTEDSNVGLTIYQLRTMNVQLSDGDRNTFMMKKNTFLHFKLLPISFVSPLPRSSAPLRPWRVLPACLHSLYLPPTTLRRGC